MKKRDWVLLILVNAFLGYLWFLFVHHVVDMVSMQNGIVLRLALWLSGTLLLFEIFHRINVQAQQSIASYMTANASFFIVVVCLFIFT